MSNQQALSSADVLWQPVWQTILTQIRLVPCELSGLSHSVCFHDKSCVQCILNICLISGQKYRQDKGYHTAQNMIRVTGLQIRVSRIGKLFSSSFEHPKHMF